MTQQKRRGRPKDPEGIRHPLQVRIVSACTRGEVAVADFAAMEKKPRSTVAYHFRALLKKRYIRISKKERDHGGVRYFYVADRKAIITDREFEQMTDKQKHQTSAVVLYDFLGRAKEALETGTMDARSDSHLSWDHMDLDEEGFVELSNEYARMLERCLEIGAEASVRLKNGEERAIHTTVALAAFESPAPKAGRRG